MTDTRELQELEIISEAVALIDRGLGDLFKRELVSTDEVADLLLDVRTLLVPPPGSPDDELAELDEQVTDQPNGNPSEPVPSSN